MFRRLMRAFGRKRSRGRVLAVANISGRPVTRWLLLHADQTTFEHVNWLEGVLSYPLNVDCPSDLNSQIDSAVCVFTLEVLEITLDGYGSYWPLPNDPLPSDIHVIIAFGYWILISIFGAVGEEGYEIDFNATTVRFVNALLLLHPNDEQGRQYRLASDVFRQIACSDRANVREWRESIQQLVRFYLMQSVASNSKTLKIDSPIPLVSLLNSLLTAVE